ncbi:hypothetical protein ABPG74_019354 [Tetrahymena malaccensis]
MGCTNGKQKKEQKDPNKVRKPNAYLAEDKFWDDPSIKDNKQREQTIASIENIHYFYKFERKLGSGSFGSVTLGIPLNDPDKRVAIKTIQKESVQGIPQHYLKREVDIIKSLDHPNICKFLETYMDKENIYLVMEYCAGGTLKELIYSQNNNEFAVAKIMQKLFWAVNYMHNNNIVHRDLKLENVIFSTTNPATSDIKIIDFGLSKKVHDKQKRRHTKVGSFNYMAPEVLLHCKYDKECDVWSLGCMMFALISGELPFYDMKSIQEGKFAFDAASWKIVSKDARELIEKMLVVNTEKRITLPEAMNHSWFKRLRKNTLGTIALPRQRGSKQLVLDRLLNFKQSCMFKREVLQIIVKQMESNENMTPKDIFALIDKNGNGFITVQDIKEVVKRLNLEGEQFKDDKAIEDLVQTISKSNQSNLEPISPTNKTYKNYQTIKEAIKKINYSEFLAATLDEQYYLNTQKLQKAFKYMDASETNFISKEDIMDVFAREGRKLPPEDIEAIMVEISPYLDKKGNLNFEGFCDVMRMGCNQQQQDIKDIVVEEKQENVSSCDNSSDYESEDENDKKENSTNNQNSNQNNNGHHHQHNHHHKEKKKSKVQTSKENFDTDITSKNNTQQNSNKQTQKNAQHA